MTTVRAAHAGERQFSVALDRWSPGLLGLAVAFAADAGTAHVMVERAWLRALRRGQLDGPADGTRVTLVRAMTETGADERDAAVIAGQRALRLAVRAGGVLVLPRQRDPRRARPTTVPVLPDGLRLDDLHRLSPPLRLMLLLTDVQQWPAVEVEALLEVRAEVRRAILSHAREELASALVLRSA
jgi:hypothetical protein